MTLKVTSKVAGKTTKNIVARKVIIEGTNVPVVVKRITSSAKATKPANKSTAGKRATVAAPPARKEPVVTAPQVRASQESATKAVDKLVRATGTPVTTPEDKPIAKPVPKPVSKPAATRMVQADMTPAPLVFPDQVPAPVAAPAHAFKTVAKAAPKPSHAEQDIKVTIVDTVVETPVEETIMTPSRKASGRTVTVKELFNTMNQAQNNLVRR